MRLSLVASTTLALGLGLAGCSGSSASTTPPGGTNDAGQDSPVTGFDSGTTADGSVDSGTVVDSGTTPDAGGDSGTGNGDGGSTAAKACADEAVAVCTLRSTCSPFDLSAVYPSLTSCETRTAAVCVTNLAANGTGQTPAGVEACAQAYPSEACADYFDGDPVAACVPPAGTGQTGGLCGASAQCTSTFCAVSEYQVCGTCQALPVAGATCQVDADCGRDLSCAVPTGATSGKCAAWGASGGTCLTGYQPCAFGLACVGDDEATMTTGTCQASGATMGAACQTTRKTMPNCNATLGLVCIAAAGSMGVGTCQSIQLVGPGVACGDTGGNPPTGYAECTAGGLCAKPLTDAGTLAASGVCVAPVADGTACDNDPSKGPPCLAPAKCVPASAGVTAGTCTLPNATKCM
jgi:hypothetical protein